MVGQWYVAGLQAKQHGQDSAAADRVGRVTRLLDLVGGGEHANLDITSNVGDIQLARCILIPEQVDCGSPDAKFDEADPNRGLLDMLLTCETLLLDAAATDRTSELAKLPPPPEPSPTPTAAPRRAPPLDEEQVRIATAIASKVEVDLAQAAYGAHAETEARKVETPLCLRGGELLVRERPGATRVYRVVVDGAPWCYHPSEALDRGEADGLGPTENPAPARTIPPGSHVAVIARCSGVLDRTVTTCLARVEGAGGVIVPCSVDKNPMSAVAIELTLHVSEGACPTDPG